MPPDPKRDAAAGYTSRAAGAPPGAEGPETPATAAPPAAVGARGRLDAALLRLVEAHQKFGTGRCSRAAILLAENAVFCARADLIEAEFRGR